MIDIESRVADSLQARADRGIKVDGLRERAVARAGSIRRRRQALGALAGVGLAAVLSAGVIAVPRLLPAAPGTAATTRPGVVPPAGTGPAHLAGPTTLPAADAPSAAEQPAALGTDPGLLHFDLDVAALGAKVSEWTSADGYEAVALPTSSGGRHIQVLVNRGSKPLDPLQAGLAPGAYALLSDGSRIPLYDEGPEQQITVGGRPATIQKVTSLMGRDIDKKVPAGKTVRQLASAVADPDAYAWVLRWQPMDGLHAVVQVTNADRSVALKVADALRLDRAQRCVLPVRLTDVPAGATWTRCQTVVRRQPLAGGGVFVQGGITLRQPDGHAVQVWVEDAKLPRHPHDADQFHPNRTVAGHPAMWMTGTTRGLWVDKFGAVGTGVWPGDAAQQGPLTEQEALRLAGGLRVVGDLADPQTWPPRALG